MPMGQAAAPQPVMPPSPAQQTAPPRPQQMPPPPPPPASPPPQAVPQNPPPQPQPPAQWQQPPPALAQPQFQYPPQYQPPPQYYPPTVQAGGTPMSTYMVGALITALVGALMLLVGEFAGAYWNTGSVEGWVYVGLSSGLGAALILVILALGLFIAAYIAGMGLRAPPPVSRLRVGFILSTVVTVIVFVLGLIFVGVAISEEWDEWWISEGGWGGLFGGLLTALFFYLALRQAKATAAPYQVPPQPMPQPFPQIAPTMAPPRAP